MKSFSIVNIVFELLSLHLSSKKYAKNLLISQNNTRDLSSDSIILFSYLGKPTNCLKSFLAHYRLLGVTHFIFIIDNNSEIVDLLNTKDITLFTHASKQHSQDEEKKHYINHLLKTYGNNCWCLICNQDEYLLYPYMNSRKLSELTHDLDSRYTPCLSCLSIDYKTYNYNMDDALNKFSFSHSYNPKSLRIDFFDNENTTSQISIKRIPLLKWKKIYGFSSYKLRSLMPNKLNRQAWGFHVTGLLIKTDRDFSDFTNNENIWIKLCNHGHMNIAYW